MLLVVPEQNIVYSSAEYFKIKVLTEAINSTDINYVVINGESINVIDSTVAIVNIEIIFFRAQNIFNHI